ncbi:lipid-binding protein [Flavobacterium cellulosilyticum]|uniref:Inverse autotransporter beta-domain domain-containing protein n=1 Tax=Flavobacterium cellulosilyticum TaxID=2541731 RepID=A0A4R5CA66_9FLAO|nr:lipid-binding protein [Flavobacterium cellulosilyticum]TDD95080.1 hypothetical protein E0F76_14975 [Flavobacterium cellulosilyticum]
MKSFFLPLILFVFSLKNLHAQDIETTIKEQSSTVRPKESLNYFVEFGLNVIDNGRTKSPFDSERLEFKNPFFISLEHKSKSNFSIALRFSSNEIRVKSEDRSYFGLDLSGRYYFDDYIFKNKDIDTYVGLGLGRFYLQNGGNNTFNVSFGGRYWFSKSFAVSFQSNGKLALDPINPDVQNYYQYNFGIVWRTNFKKVTPSHKSVNSELKLLEDQKKMGQIAEKVADKIIEKMAKNEAKKDKLAQAIVSSSNNKTELDPNTSARILASRSDYGGNWYISVSKKNGSKIFNNVLHSTNFPSLDDNTMWISDDKKGTWLKCKIDLNLFDGTFSATSEPNVFDKGTVTITEGKIEKGAALSKTGHIVDKISFKAQFSYDPNNVLIFEGHKSTGQEVDEY